MYSPAQTRGLHGRAARCIWALVSQRGTHKALPQGRLRLVLVLAYCGSLARWSGNLRRMNLLRLSHEKAKHQ